MSLPYPSFFYKGSETTSKIWSRAPYVGEHNEDIYRHELGLDEKQLVALPSDLKIQDLNLISI